MRVLPQARPTVRSVNDIPSAIWMPNASQAILPSCYQGTPMEMVEEMAQEMNPKFGIHDAIDTSLQMLHESGFPVTPIPSGAHEEVRAAMFVAGLLMWGVAEPMAQA